MRGLQKNKKQNRILSNLLQSTERFRQLKEKQTDDD